MYPVRFSKLSGEILRGQTIKTTDSNRHGRALISLTKAACCIGLILAFACLGLADSVPLATYSLSFQAGPTAPPQVISNPVVPDTVASIIQSVGLGSGAQYTGKALASTFTPLFVNVQGEADAVPSAPLTSVALASTIVYYFQVEQTAPAPVDVVPLLIQSNVEADAGAAGDGVANAAAAFLVPALNISHPVTALCNGIDGCTSSSSMSFNDSASATAGQNTQVQIVASGDAGAFGAIVVGGHATFQAIADPSIQIDPSFAFANDFALAFSPNLTSSVPEPSSIALSATGLLVLMGVLSSSGLRRRFED